MLRFVRKQMRNIISPFARTARGVELWRGPSAFDGKDIVVIATFISDNIKTGDMIQTWVFRTDRTPVDTWIGGGEPSICGSCPMQHKSSGGSSLCYVNRIPLNQIYNAWKRGLYPKFNPKLHLRYFAGRPIRLGAYGDVAMAPIKVFLPILKVTSGHTGYTHQYKTYFGQDWKQYLMASTESLATYRAAKKLGWRSFRIRATGEPTLPGERVCPASEEGGYRVQCLSCMACHGAKSKGRADISVLVHGRNGTPVSFTRLSVAGKFLPFQMNSPASRPINSIRRLYA